MLSRGWFGTRHAEKLGLAGVFLHGFAQERPNHVCCRQVNGAGTVQGKTASSRS